LHVALLAVSLACLPIIASSSWKPQGNEEPVLRILLLLVATIGLPYFLLSTTTPLLQAWYWRRFQSAVPYRLFALSNFVSLLVLLPAMAYYVPSLDLRVAAPLYLVGLFFTCMFCHGELARAKPDPSHLTRFYLMISLGGALGAVLVAIVAPLVLPGYFELGITLLVLSVIVAMRLQRLALWGGVAVAMATTVFVVHGMYGYTQGMRVMERDFYGVV